VAVSMSASVIVPAHNEEAVLRNSLETLLDGLPDEVAVVVVCNGCTDSTADIAKAFVPRITVLELATASKPEAINAAESALEAGSRAFIDADVLISGRDVGRLLASVGADVPAAEPRVHFDVSSSTVSVRAYYKVWVALHGEQPGDIGGGVYCLSEIGRHRFGKFPDVISDDGYVRAHFAPGEIKRVENASSTVRAPLSLGSLIRIKTRSRLGTAELQRRFPDLWNRRMTSSRSLGSKLSGLPPSVWPAVPLYVVVQLIVRLRAWRQAGSSTLSWERDTTTRTTT